MLAIAMKSFLTSWIGFSLKLLHFRQRPRRQPSAHQLHQHAVLILKQGAQMIRAHYFERCFVIKEAAFPL